MKGMAGVIPIEIECSAGSVEELLIEGYEDATGSLVPMYILNDSAHNIQNVNVKQELIQQEEHNVNESNVVFVEVDNDGRITSMANESVKYFVQGPIMHEVNDDMQSIDMSNMTTVTFADGTQALVDLDGTQNGGFGVAYVQSQEDNEEYDNDDNKIEFGNGEFSFVSIPAQGLVELDGGNETETTVLSSSKRRHHVCSHDGCGSRFLTKHHLKVHERTHTGERPYPCTVCNRQFATGYSLKTHHRTHTGIRPYRCLQDDCPKSFKTSGDLQKHTRTHTGERPFPCLVSGCHNSFTTSNIRKVHMRTHTGERPYQCTMEGCGKRFASATNYRNHERIHSGHKPYECQLCHKRFTEYSSLYKHHVVHMESKKIKCDVCGKTYRQISTLNTHRRTVHHIESSTVEDEANEDEPGNLVMDERILTSLGEAIREPLGAHQYHIEGVGIITVQPASAEPKLEVVVEEYDDG